MNLFAPKYKMASYLVTCTVIFAVLAVLGYYAMSQLGTVKKPKPQMQVFASDLTYYDMPRLTLAVMSSEGTTHIRLDISLEVAKKDMTSVERYQPRVTDKITTYLSRVDPSLFTRSKSISTLREDILAQVNAVGLPAPVHDILFRQMVVM